MTVRSQTFEIEAGQLAAELSRRGVAPERRVMVTIEPDDEVYRAHLRSRERFEAAGYSDADLPRLIKEARTEANAETQ